MMICNLCGIKYEDGDTCEKCGSSLEVFSEASETSNNEDAETNSSPLEKTEEEETTVNALEEKEEIAKELENQAENPEVAVKEEEVLSPKEARKKAKEEQKLAKAEAKRIKEEEKAAKLQAKLDKKQAALEAKMKKQEEREAKAKAKEEKRIRKAEKKANRKFKKTRKFLWFLLLLIVILIGTSIWYLGHSEIENTYTEGDANTATILKLIAEDKELNGKVKVGYDDFNTILNNEVDFSKVDVVSMATVTNGYYSSEEKRFVISLSSFLGETSLLLEAEIELEGNKVMMSLDEARLGMWKLPIPQSMAKTPIEQSFDLPQFAWIKIIDIDLEKDGVELDYKFNIDKINDDFKALNSELDPKLASYIENSKIKLPASEIILQKLSDEDYIYTEKDVQGILEAFEKDGENIANWSLILPEKLKDDFIDLSNIIAGEKKTKEKVNNSKEERQKLLENYETFMNDEAESDITATAKIVFENLKTYHDIAGVPSYYYGDKGKLYSQTLQEFISLDMISVDLDENLKDLEDKNYKLYAFANKAILARESDKDILYVEEGETEVKKMNKKKFFELIDYKDKIKHTAETPKYQEEALDFAKAIKEEENYGDNDMLEIMFLSHDNQYAIAIGFLINNPEIAPKYYLMSNKEGAWQVINSFDENQRLGEELIQEIISGEISPQILPKYEMADFERGFLSTADRKAIEEKLNALSPSKSKITFYSKIDDNIYLVAKDENDEYIKCIMPNGIEGDIKKLNPEGSLASYVDELSPKEDYDNYKPEFIFKQIPGFFGNE